MQGSYVVTLATDSHATSVIYLSAHPTVELAHGNIMPRMKIPRIGPLIMPNTLMAAWASGPSRDAKLATRTIRTPCSSTVGD